MKKLLTALVAVVALLAASAAIAETAGIDITTTGSPRKTRPSRRAAR